MNMLSTNHEIWLIWIGAAFLIMGVVVPYCICFRRNQKRAEARLAQARELGIDKARSQYPVIDPLRCIGCGTCVGSCPESDVLAVVDGISTVVNGVRCVGHAKCEAACPVGALTVTLGDTSGRPDIPILTESHETTIPGIYIAGELGGLSLIRNAITQGRRVVNDIARTLEPERDRGMIDVAIVGAGPAGLTAALTAVEHGLSYVLLDKDEPGGTIRHYPRRKLVMTQPIDIPLYGRLKRHEYSKEELMEIWLTIVKKFALDIRAGESVNSVVKSSSGFYVRTAQSEYHARRVVLALGRRGTPRKLGVPGEELAKVTYQIADAQAYAGRKVLVVGGGDSAVEAAGALAYQDGTVAHISYRKSGFFRVKKKNELRIGELISSGRVQPVFESAVERIEETTVSLTTPKGPVTIPNEDIIVLIGGLPPFAMLRDAGITFGGRTQSREEKPPPDRPQRDRES